MGVERREKRYQKLLDCTAKSTAHIWPSPSFQGFFFSSLSLGASSLFFSGLLLFFSLSGGLLPLAHSNNEAPPTTHNAVLSFGATPNTGATQALRSR